MTNYPHLSLGAPITVDIPEVPVQSNFELSQIAFKLLNGLRSGYQTQGWKFAEISLSLSAIQQALIQISQGFQNVDSFYSQQLEIAQTTINYAISHLSNNEEVPYNYLDILAKILLVLIRNFNLEEAFLSQLSLVQEFVLYIHACDPNPPRWLNPEGLKFQVVNK